MEQPRARRLRVARASMRARHAIRVGARRCTAAITSAALEPSALASTNARGRPKGKSNAPSQGPGVASQQRVAAGNRIPGVARGTAYASLAWAPALGWRGGVEARRTGMVAVNDTNSDATPRAIVVAANVGYVARVGAWQLTGFVRSDNVFDKRYAGSVIVNEGNGRFFEPAPGRTWLVGTSASYAF